jgi:hypothetical protein
VIHGPIKNRDTLELISYIKMNPNKVLTAVAAGGSAVYLWWLNKPSNLLIQPDKVLRHDVVECATPRPGAASDSRASRLEEAKLKARDLLLRVKDEAGAPGIVVGVSIDGKVVWKEGKN